MARGSARGLIDIMSMPGGGGLGWPDSIEGAFTQKGSAMAKTYTCRDVGVDCDWKTSGATEDAVMASIQEHAAQVHPTIDLTPELVETVRKAIKEG